MSLCRICTWTSSDALTAVSVSYRNFRGFHPDHRARVHHLWSLSAQPVSRHCAKSPNQPRRQMAQTSADWGDVVLRDCLLGIRPRDNAGLGRLVATLPSLASDLQCRMRGTGAPYLTLSDVARALREAGWHAHIVKASSSPGDCCCQNTPVTCEADSVSQRRQAKLSSI